MLDGEVEESMIGVVLLGFGAPDSLQAVRPFLENVLSDLKRKNPTAFEQRAGKAEERYREIGGFSPLLEITRRQAQALESKLNTNEGRFKVYIGMRHWHPFIKDAVKDIVRDKPTEVVVLSLAPHYSRITTGASVEDFRKALTETHADIKATYIESWFDHPTYLDALVERVKEGLAQFPQDSRPKVQVIFSAHNLPQRLIETGDLYLDHLQATISGVLERLGRISWRLVFQSRGEQGKWLEPEIGEVLKRLAQEGHDRILVVPLSFISDNIETLYDIDIVARGQAESAGITIFKRAPLLNDSPQLIEAFFQMVLGKAYLKE